ncbi:MAG: beta-propeller domain-containing protein [Porticoccaceae bacterium]
MVLTRSFKFLSILFFMMAVGCGGGNNITDEDIPAPPPAPPKGLLVFAEDEQQFLDVVSQAVVEFGENYLNAEERAFAAVEDTGQSYTTTYTLEASVDEHDVVKYDGEHLFIAPSRSMDCCFILRDAIPSTSDDSNQTERGIRILRTNPEEASATEISTIPIDGNLTVEGLYNQDSKLVALRSSSWWGTFGENFSRFSSWEGQTSALDIYDISTVDQPELSWQLELEGGFVTSRRIDEHVYMISRHTPDIPGLIRYPSNQEEIDQNILLLTELSAEDVLPSILINGESSSLIEASDCLFMDKTNEIASTYYGFPVMTFVVAVNTESESVSGISCYMGDVTGIYVSENAIYLTQSDGQEDDARTLIHGFEASNELTYLGSGAVDGHLWGRGEVDFRMSEHEGYLRVVSTKYIGPWDAEDSIDHQLSVLKISPDSLDLDLVATLPNSNRPDKIGKPDESLYGVRFFGDTLYLVTFETIDPLYVLDLSNPEEPIIAGELMVPGFSDFLHSVNDDLLLGLGADEEGLVKLELFNVEDMNAPYSLGTHTLGRGGWSYSEARYNRHAFTYQQYDDSSDRFAIPLTDYGGMQDDYSEKHSLYLLEIADKDSPSLASIVEIGRINAISESWDGSGPHRSVFDGDAVYFINGSSVYSTLWTNPYEQGGPF